MASRKNMVPGVVQVAVEATLPGGEKVQCGPVTTEVWDRYLEKIRKDQQATGRREMVQTLCVSHQINERGRIDVLDKRPALIKLLADALDASGGGDIEPVISEDSVAVTVDGVTCSFSGPDVDIWEGLGESMSDGALKYGDSMRSFLADLVDDRAALAAMLAKKPALIGPLVQGVGQLAGAGIKVVVKKG
jgi:hypothetical protein